MKLIYTDNQIVFLLSPTVKFPLAIKFSVLDSYVRYPLKTGDPANSQQGQPSFSLWTSLSFHGHTYSGSDTGEVVLAQWCCHPPLCCDLKAGLIRVDSVDVAPDLSQASNSALPILATKRSLEVTFLDSLFNFVIHGRRQQRKLGGRCATDTNTDHSNELNELQQQKKFPSLPRSEIETCSLARLYPAWVLSFASRNAISVFSERDGEGAWPKRRAGSSSAAQQTGSQVPKRGRMFITHLGGCRVSSRASGWPRVAEHKALTQCPCVGQGCALVTLGGDVPQSQALLRCWCVQTWHGISQQKPG